MKRPIFQNPHLDGSTFYLEGSKPVGILLLHGFTATTVEVRPLAEFFHNSGFSVFCPLLPGHGTKPEDLIPVTWKDWYKTAKEGYQKIQHKPFRFVAGESMGALLSLLLAAEVPDINGIILFAPALKIKNIWQAKWLAPFIKIMPKNYLPEEDEEDQTLPWQGYNVVTLPAVAQLEKLQKEVMKILPLIHQPVIIFQGKLDHTIDPAGSEIILEKIPAAQKSIIRLEKSGHCVVLDRELETVKALTLNFIERLLVVAHNNP